MIGGGHEDKLYVGWQVDMEVELPRTYFRLREQSDFTANLTLSRMKVQLWYYWSGYIPM